MLCYEGILETVEIPGEIIARDWRHATGLLDIGIYNYLKFYEKQSDILIKAVQKALIYTDIYSSVYHSQQYVLGFPKVTGNLIYCYT